MIKFENVIKTYNKSVRAVDDVSFEVKGGEIVGFIGPNGSGKTTTMKLLTGIIRPDSGKITINGFNIRKDPIKAKECIGYIADSPDMFLRLKGTEFLELIADIYHVPDEKRRERVERLAATFGLTEALSSPMMLVTTSISGLMDATMVSSWPDSSGSAHTMDSATASTLPR